MRLALSLLFRAPAFNGASLPVICLLAAPVLRAAEADRKSFNIPQDAAERSLRVFSVQSGAHVIFPSDVTRGVRTPAVQGRFTVREALDRLLAGTGLVAAHDQQTGGFTVQRVAEQNSASPAPTPPRSASAALPSPAETAATGDGTVALTPFEVRAELDRGFAATSSLAGGRLATDLRDTPAAFSVMTREFIDALNIVDLEQAAEWMVGNAPVLDAGVGLFFGNPGQFDTRGFRSFGGTNGGAKPQRNFFTAFISPDSYVTERYEFGRGPNAILFGNGTLGGIPTTTTKRARTDKAFRTAQLSAGSWENFRGSLDVNQPLLDGRAAVRMALLRSDAKGWRDRDFNRRSGNYLTTTFKPFAGTEIRLEGEYYKNSRMTGYTNYEDRFTGWNGTTTFSTPNPLATLPANADALGLSRFAANYFVYHPGGPADAIFNYQNEPMTLGGGATATTPLAGFTSGGFRNAAGATANIAFNSANSRFIHQPGLPDARYAVAIGAAGAPAITPLLSEKFTTSHDGPTLVERFRDLQLTITQRVGQSLFFELAGDTNRSKFDGFGLENRGLAQVFLDVNRVLPNGAPNPNFLKPFADAQLIRNNFVFEYEALRGAAAYVAPETRFGKFSFNVLGGFSEATRDQDYRYLTLADGADARQWGSPALQSVRVRYYLTDGSARPYPESLAGRPTSFVDPVTGATRTVSPIFAIDNTREDTQSIDTTKLTYALASMNAKFLKDRLVVLGAVRYDRFTFDTKFTKNRGDYPRNWDGVTRILRPDVPADYFDLTFQPTNTDGTPSGPVRQADVRPRIAATGDPEPRYANVRFQDDYNRPTTRGHQVTRSIGSVVHAFPWLNPYFNYAQTFNPPEGTVRINRQLREPTVAIGKDYGVRLELLKGRLNINLNHYEAEEDNTVEGAQPPDFNVIYNANVVGDLSVTGRNNRGVEPLPLVWRDSRTRVSEGDEVEITFNATRGLRLTANFSKPQVGSGNRYPDTLPYIDENRGLLRQIVMDAGGLVDAADVATVDLSIPVNQRSPDVQAAVNTYNQIANFYRTWSGATQSIGDAQETGNFFADYTFQESWLKRLRVGGGVKWRGKVSIGNRAGDTVRDANDPLRAIDDPAVGATDIVYRPSYSTVTMTLGYSWRLWGRSFRGNMVVDNLLNDRGPLYIGTALRPKDGDYSSPARETVPAAFNLKKPISFNLSVTVDL